MTEVVPNPFVPTGYIKISLAFPALGKVTNIHSLQQRDSRAPTTKPRPRSLRLAVMPTARL